MDVSLTFCSGKETTCIFDFAFSLNEQNTRHLYLK